MYSHPEQQDCINKTKQYIKDLPLFTMYVHNTATWRLLLSYYTLHRTSILACTSQICPCTPFRTIKVCPSHSVENIHCTILPLNTHIRICITKLSLTLLIFIPQSDLIEKEMGTVRYALHFTLISIR